MNLKRVMRITALLSPVGLWAQSNSGCVDGPCGGNPSLSPKEFHCPPGYVSTGDTYDKNGHVNHHCARVASPPNNASPAIPQSPRPSDEGDAGESQDTPQNLYVEPGTVAHDSSIDDLLSPSAKKEVPKKVAPTIAEMNGSIAKYLQSAAEAWKSLNREAHVTEPLALSLEAYKMAKASSGGEAGATLQMVERLADYVGKEARVLDTFTVRRAPDWLAKSRVNSFDPSTIPRAQGYLDDLSSRLATMQRLIQQFLPSIEAARDVLANPIVDGARSAAAMNTLPGMDPIALGDIIAQLNGCSAQIDAIRANLRLARSVV